MTGQAAVPPMERIEVVGEWLGARGARERGLDPGRTVQFGSIGASCSNAEALAALPLRTAGELVHIPQGISRILTTFRTSPAPSGSAQEGVVGRFWAELIDRFPRLPWPSISVVRGVDDFPRAFSVPGAIVLSPKMAAHPYSAEVLYVTHELIHQWLGGVSMMPSRPRDAEIVEALIDALVWDLAGSVGGGQLDAAFGRLYARYLAVDEMAGHGARVRRLRGELGKGGWEALARDLEDAEAARAAGVRLVIDVRIWR